MVIESGASIFLDAAVVVVASDDESESEPQAAVVAVSAKSASAAMSTRRIDGLDMVGLPLEGVVGDPAHRRVVESVTRRAPGNVGQPRPRHGTSHRSSALTIPSRARAVRPMTM